MIFSSSADNPMIEKPQHKKTTHNLTQFRFPHFSVVVFKNKNSVVVFVSIKIVMAECYNSVCKVMYLYIKIPD